jgi:hypothetical protein
MGPELPDLSMQYGVIGAVVLVSLAGFQGISLALKIVLKRYTNGGNGGNSLRNSAAHPEMLATCARLFGGLEANTKDMKEGLSAVSGKLDSLLQQGGVTDDNSRRLDALERRFASLEVSVSKMRPKG